MRKTRRISCCSLAFMIQGSVVGEAEAEAEIIYTSNVITLALLGRSKSEVNGKYRHRRVQQSSSSII
jgi:hypothetical protein